MPRAAKKAGAQKSGRQVGAPAAQTDFTLAHFADADPALVGSGGRMKKGLSKPDGKSLMDQNKDMVVEKTPVDKSNLAWDEKELSDFEVELDNNAEAGKVEEQENVEGSPRAKVKRKQRQEAARAAAALQVEDTGVEYPVDIWFLIADRIAPESVATFSAICQGAHAVSHTARFWNSLYRRHYNDDADLPKDLKPGYMLKLHGLRSRIVRALFYLYPPLVQRIKALVPFEQQVDSLQGHQCVLMWYQRVKQTWHFFFKFKRAGRKQCILTQPDRRDKFWPFVPDIYANEEEDCSILQVVMTDFTPLPPVMALRLRKTAVSVGHAMRYHKLRLIFTHGHVGADRVSQDNGVVIVMDPVINIRVLEWWNPSYPKTGPSYATPPTTPS